MFFFYIIIVAKRKKTWTMLCYLFVPLKCIVSLKIVVWLHRIN